MPFNDLEACERILRENADELACVIMEAVSSSFGYLPADVDFLRGIREITEELGIVLIFDEVQSFRVSAGGAQEMMGRHTGHDDVRQDNRRRHACGRVGWTARHQWRCSIRRRARRWRTRGLSTRTR